MSTREFRDPVHRFIHFNPGEMEIIGSKPFQRLRFIHQLGITYYVYPGAMHTRFEHSLGVTELATKVFDIIKEKNKELFEQIIPKDDFEKYKQILRIASLLHDIGHFPFSHSAEGIWPQKHEEYSKEIIMSDTIKKIIKEGFPPEMDIKTSDVSYVASGRPEKEDARLSLLNEILTGELGVDRIDYLVRDSLHTGVLYGMFDYYRLLDTFTISLDWEDNPLLCLEKGGVNSAEGLIIARYFMFLQVYFHKSRRAYDLLLTNYMKEFLKYSKDELKIDYATIKDFLKLNDFIVLNQMNIDSENKNGDKRNKIANLIINREHHHRVEDIDGNTLSGNKELIYEEFKNRLKIKYQKEIDDEIILFDTAEAATNKFEKANFFIVNDDGEKKLILAESELIKKLDSINIFRVYVARGHEHIEPEIKTIINKVKQKYIS